MDILNLYEKLKGSYKDYLESFVAIKDKRIEERVHEAIAKETLWPDALIQFNPNYEKGKTIAQMIDDGLPIDPGLSFFFENSWFTEEYTDQEDFKRWRNNIGGLLLLHKSINASLNDKKYDYKIQKYCSAEGNIYTESLGQQAYMNNPQFMRFVKTNNLSFEPYAQFGKDEITKRNSLFAQLVSLIWNTRMFETE